MTENFRNSKEIHDFASYIISKTGNEYLDNSQLMRNNNGLKITIPYDLDLLSEIIKAHDDFKDWFVLTRTNKQLYAICQFLQLKKIPCTSFKQGDLSLEDLNKKMEENTVKVLTLHSSKGLQNKNVANKSNIFYSQGTVGPINSDPRISQVGDLLANCDSFI